MSNSLNRSVSNSLNHSHTNSLGERKGRGREEEGNRELTRALTRASARGQELGVKSHSHRCVTQRVTIATVGVG